MDRSESWPWGVSDSTRQMRSDQNPNLSQWVRRKPRGPGRAPGLWQLRHPQEPSDPPLAHTAPRFHVHYTPTYSGWINQIERWFAYLTERLLGRSDHRSVHALER